MPGGYLHAWENFWRDAPTEPGGVFWDAEPSVTAALHLPLLEPHADPGLPIVDLGCGNGTQTRFLAERYDRVVGIDIAESAIALARAADPGGAAGYLQMNGADKTEIERLHTRLGDANVYMRGVLHQCDLEERAPLVEGIAILTGGRGRAFVIELAASAKDVLVDLVQSPGGPPPKLAAIFAHGIAPGEVADEDVPAYFRAAGLQVLAEGRMALTTTEHRADGTLIKVPTNWLVAGRSS